MHGTENNMFSDHPLHPFTMRQLVPLAECGLHFPDCFASFSAIQYEKKTQAAAG
jgi:hypothetical protein